MENMVKGVTLPKLVLKKLAANASQIICPSTKVWDLYEKKLHWASVVRGAGLPRHK